MAMASYAEIYLFGPVHLRVEIWLSPEPGIVRVLHQMSSYLTVLGVSLGAVLMTVPCAVKSAVGGKGYIGAGSLVEHWRGCRASSQGPNRRTYVREFNDCSKPSCGSPIHSTSRTY
jgi:hypothetical protein